MPRRQAGNLLFLKTLRLFRSLSLPRNAIMTQSPSRIMTQRHFATPPILYYHYSMPPNKNRKTFGLPVLLQFAAITLIDKKANLFSARFFLTLFSKIRSDVFPQIKFKGNPALSNFSRGKFGVSPARSLPDRVYEQITRLHHLGLPAIKSQAQAVPYTRLSKFPYKFNPRMSVISVRRSFP